MRAEFDPQNLQKTAKPQEWWHALAIAELERRDRQIPEACWPTSHAHDNKVDT